MILGAVVGRRQSDQKIHRGRLPGCVFAGRQDLVGHPEEGQQKEGLIFALVPPVGKAMSRQ